MPIDLSRFHAVFFEESFEALDAMEQALLKLDVGAADAELINTIFRAAHSIKGGAATFGFAAVAGFTHHVETLLDRMRAGRRKVDQPLVDLLLRAADAIRALVTAARDGQADTLAGPHPLEPALKAALNPSDSSAAPPAPALVPATSAPTSTAPSPPIAGYQIRFAPKPSLFRSGNDPLRILRELDGMGRLEVELDLAAAPSFAELDPESCMLAWNLKLLTDCSRDEIRELFAWVDDECDLSIRPLGSRAAPAPPAASLAAAAPAAPVVERATTAAAKAPAAEPAAKHAPRGAGEAASIRVGTDKIDSLIDLVGELVITQSMLAQIAASLDRVANERLIAGLQQLDHHTRLLQEAVLSTRMLPIEHVFSRFPRMVRDLSTRLGKQVRLQTIGEGTELDKSVIEKIADPLTHLVRNCIDHGIEAPDRRVAAGKDACGTITLKAAHQGGQIVIEVADDGGGLDRQRILDKARSQGLAISATAEDAEVWQLIFAPGFSTAENVTDVSGRGVGMDVVKRNVQALGGQIEIASRAGRGTRITTRLPLTLAILDGMSIAVGAEIFIIPLTCVVESLQPKPEQIKRVAGQGGVVRIREEYLPLMALHEVFHIDKAVREPHRGIVVVLEAEGRKIALQVDDLVSQQQVVIKNLETNFRRVSGVSGATILGDGRVALILDAAELVRRMYRAAAA